MKIRMDFVTNSSSSSFVLARTSELNERQKGEILKYVVDEFLGKSVLTPESSEEEIEKVFDENWEFEDEDIQQEVRRALKDGKSVYSGWVDYEECEYLYATIFEEIWKIMKEKGDGDFLEIKGDLSY